MTLQRLAGRAAIVTGGAQGIGGATARRLAEEGARVLIVDVDADAAAHNAATIASAGGEADVLLTDVGTEDGVRDMIAARRGPLGPTRHSGQQRLRVPRPWRRRRGPGRGLGPRHGRRTQVDVPRREVRRAAPERRRRRLDRQHRLGPRPAGRAARGGVRDAQDGGHRADALARRRLRSGRHPGQRDLPGLDRHRAQREGSGRRTATAFPSSSATTRSAAPGSPWTSRMRSSFCVPTKRRSSPATRWWSTAGSRSSFRRIWP